MNERSPAGGVERVPSPLLLARKSQVKAQIEYEQERRQSGPISVTRDLVIRGSLAAPRFSRPH